MENDSVRSMGDSTVVDLWIQGKFRAITISREAIESCLRLTPGDSGMSDTDRREFVRTHLGLIVKAAIARLNADPGTEQIVIEAGQLGGELQRGAGERRSSDRRKGERRKQNLGPPGGIERRES
jgi:hypothetical protein